MFIPVLNSEVPPGGFGRPLTSTEVVSIRKAGHSCGRGWIVLRLYGSPSRGVLYRPGRSGGFDSTGIKVEMK